MLSGRRLRVMPAEKRAAAGRVRRPLSVSAAFLPDRLRRMKNGVRIVSEHR